MKKRTKKLSLSKETVRSLDSARLAAAHGGTEINIVQGYPVLGDNKVPQDGIDYGFYSILINASASVRVTVLTCRRDGGC